MKFCWPLNWEVFTKAVLLRFGPTDYEDPSEALSCLKQTTTQQPNKKPLKSSPIRLMSYLNIFLLAVLLQDSEMTFA